MTRHQRWRPIAFPERGLARTVQALLALVLLLPLVMAPETVYPYVVGKALYARVLIALAFAAWAVLALARPAWRPPRSTLLLLLGLWAAVTALAAVFGVSPQRSVWSYYGRMQGLFDLAHWIAFAVVAASVLKTSRDWGWMLLANQAVGLATAAQAIAGAVAPEWFGSAASRHELQASGLMGNAGFLAAYMLAVAVLAAGFLARAAMRPASAPAAIRAQRRRRRSPPPPARKRRWPALCFHGGTLALALWALALAGSRGAMVGLAAGGAFGALLLAFALPGVRVRIASLAAVGVLAVLGAAVGGVLAWRVATAGAEGGRMFDIVFLERLTSPSSVTVSAGSRFDNWRAGIEAFAERPLLGWGPDNYLAAAGRHLAADSGRHLASKGTANEGRDHAHNTLVEEAATKGVLGLAAWLALWGWTFVVSMSAVRRAEAGDRAVVAGVAGALAGWFVQSLTWFYFPAAWLVHLLPLAFLARCEAADVPAAPAKTGLRRWRWPRFALGAGALALAAGSLAANRAVYAGAAALYRAETGGSGRFMTELEASIHAFGPMATHPRILLFENVAPNWAVLRARYPDEAFRLLTWADGEAPKALVAEPYNWQLHHSLAHLYREVAKTEPGYGLLAESFHASALEVAPNLDPTLPMRYVRE